MSTDVRRATPDDLSGVSGVFLGCWRESYRDILPAEAIEAMTDERAQALWQRVLASTEGAVLVAVQGGKIVGVTRYALNESQGAVHSLYVSPAAQGAGIGRMLLDAATAELRAAGADSALLWVFAANAPSIRFYESRGWRHDGVTRVQEEFGQPEQRMRREWT